MGVDLKQYEDELVEIVTITGERIVGRAEFMWADDSSEGFEEMVDRLIIDDEETGKTVGYLSSDEIQSICIIQEQTD